MVLQTSRWARRLEELGIIDLDWGLFSLELQNAGKEPEEMARAHARSERALRTAVAVRDAAGRKAVGAFYEAVGERVHEQGEALEDPTTVEAALSDAGLDPALCAKAWEDPSTAERVAGEHRELCQQTRSFGVPTIVLEAGTGPPSSARSSPRSRMTTTPRSCGGTSPGWHVTPASLSSSATA